MGNPDPTRLRVHKSLKEIIRHASARAQLDYNHSLDGLELRMLTAVYVRRAADMLEDGDLDLEEKKGELCLGRMIF